MSVRADGAGVDLGYGELDVGQYPDFGPIDLFTGGAVLLDAAMLAAIGGLDERYFLYYEDIDLARRGTEAGWRYVVEPAAVVHHAISSTAGATPDLYRYWQERNRLWCLFRHAPAHQILRGLVLSLARLAKHPTRPQATAIRDGLAGLPRCLRERRERPVVAPLPPRRRGPGRSTDPLVPQPSAAHRGNVRRFALESVPFCRRFLGWGALGGPPRQCATVRARIGAVLSQVRGVGGPVSARRGPRRGAAPGG